MIIPLIISLVDLFFLRGFGEDPFAACPLPISQRIIHLKNILIFYLPVMGCFRSNLSRKIRLGLKFRGEAEIKIHQRTIKLIETKRFSSGANSIWSFSWVSWKINFILWIGNKKKEKIIFAVLGNLFWNRSPFARMLCQYWEGEGQFSKFHWIKFT